MRVVVNGKNLIKAVLSVEKIISKNQSLPILGNILIKTENGRIKLSATNLEIGINYYIGSKIEEIGEIAVPARILSDFISNIDEEKIILTSKNNNLLINTNKFKTQILSVDPKEFPIIPKIKNNSNIKISSKILKNLLTTTLDSIAVSESRPELNGVFIQFNENQIIFTSTDSFRLTEKIININNDNNFNLILPRNTVIELIRLIGDLNNDINIKYGENQISFYNDDMELLSRIIDGKYPDYKKIIPDRFISKILIKKEEFEKKVRISGLFSSNISDIKINCDDKKTTIYSKNSNKGEIETIINSELKNTPFDISLNYHYLLDGLKIIPSNDVIIEYTGHGSPLVLKPHPDTKDLVYIIMPLRK